MRYVILEHRQVGSTHWDLMLARPEGSLRTWKLAESPTTVGWRQAQELPDHRAVYLTYQGSISGSRGWVTCWDEGSYRLCDENPDMVRFLVNGKRLQGCWEFRREAGGDQGWQWRLQP